MTDATPIEAAFSWGEFSEGWHARITWKCCLCGRRNSKLMQGPGKMAEHLPLKVQCKFSHETLVIPYRFYEEKNC